MMVEHEVRPETAETLVASLEMDPAQATAPARARAPREVDPVVDRRPRSLRVRWWDAFRMPQA